MRPNLFKTVYVISDVCMYVCTVARMPASDTYRCVFTENIDIIIACVFISSLCDNFYNRIPFTILLKYVCMTRKKVYVYVHNKTWQMKL
jgi:hypothetical protein